MKTRDPLQRIRHEAGLYRRSGFLLAFLVIAHVPACATQLTVVPPLAESGAPPRSIAVRLEYDGRPEYVPRALRVEPNADLTVRYSVEARTGRDDFPDDVVLFNPLTLFGFPTGSSTANASGRLDVFRADRAIHQYQASATLRKRNHLYSGDSLTLLRRSALLAVRDSLEAQLLNDLEALLSEPSPASILDDDHLNDDDHLKGM